MKILREKYYNLLKLIEYNNNFYTIEFDDNSSEGITLLMDDTFEGIVTKWITLLNIICELVELDMDYSKESLKKELERIHGKLDINFDILYNLRKEFV